MIASLGLLVAFSLMSSRDRAITQPGNGSLPRLTARDAQLIVNGRPFEVRGVNYIRPSGADPSCPELHFGADATCPWDRAAIDADLDRFRDHGVNTLRIFLNYYVFGGARESNPAYDMQPALEHLDVFIADANERGMHVLPVLLAKYPQDRFGPQYYTTTLDLHVRPVVAHLANRSGVLGWDLFNEPDIGSPIDVRCWDWDNGDFPLCLELANERLRFLTMLHGEVAALDPEHLTTIGMAFAKSYFEPAAADVSIARLVDFYSFHYYDNDPYDSGRYAAHWYYGTGFPHDLARAIDELVALPGDKPIVITEIGFPTGDQALRDEAELRRDLRLALQTSRERGASGIMLWPFQSDSAEIAGDLFRGRR
jgi:hypothetical protein